MKPSTADASGAVMAAARKTKVAASQAAVPSRVGPSGYATLSVEAAHNGLIVRRPIYGDRCTLASADETAVFTDAEAFGRWMAEHFRQNMRNVLPSKGEG